ncbi:MAG: 23S rRNA (adenine(2030)-N(6))-methyltransferase RlmJ [Succinatimonas sp.]|jgi:23S rRNA (adenine2030-N6)-methyltransferase|nr:23S rRNA (adenine(2030)-N(6))-methyltransferase RlmJ [Succinatimonas sp.]MDD5869314.1 23S rRNA (adenine(2030)-N(6))-methyltransferase RlmJ [Succinatimonas sp.]MDY5722039.1 23S rRNA (adenine(2030)-N(6))-methyltransferase RlmJ [Succinivibrio sp.]
MLSYKHGFHSGNHADIIKHMTLCVLLRILNQKEKPYTLIDTHSGSGLYKLDSFMAQKNEEFRSGISKIENNQVLKELVPEFYEVFDAVNTEVKNSYPGSPFFEAMLTRETDKLTFIDLHPSEFENLRNNFKRDHRCTIQCREGLAALNALLPPTPRRGMVLIDPAYEEKNEYIDLVKAVKHGLSKWATGVFAIWYPVLGKLRDHSKNLTNDLRRLNVPLLQVELCVEPQEEVFGMCGSGMLILNYPYNLDKELSPVVDELYKALSRKGGSARLKVINAKE